MIGAKVMSRRNSYLPIIPEKVNGKENCSVLLTNRNETEWKFLFEEIIDIPNAFSDNQDYDYCKIDEGKWQNVAVPSSLIMQGFNIENNTEYYYKKTVLIPDEFKGEQLYLRFEGVYSNARVWVNNKFIASHIGGFTAWDVDITDFSYENEITLIIGVADLEGDKKSPWNTDGKYQSNSAWASYYAHHNIGGIIRDITMFCLPQKAILQTHIDTFINSDTSIVKINMLFSEECDGFTLKADIIDGVKVKAEKTIGINNTNVSFALNVSSAKLWDAEHPNLYTLKTALYDERDNVIQENSIKFGFREITYGGKNGTDINKIYINGKEIKLHGVCRHDVSRLYGRSITKEDIYNEIKTYKSHNINHIRTSHYPASDYMLEVCDELGMYVEQENAACFKGANSFEIYNPPNDFLNSFKEMVEYSRNHSSVIIWSIANESNFEKSSGFRDCYDYIKRTDLTRPVIFSYPHTVKSKPLPYDIYSKHYAKVTSDLGNSNIPVLHDEFAHVPCYNIEDLLYDNSSRVFWGESIKRGWDNAFNTSGSLGCDIWGAIDDVFYLPEKNMKKHQIHLKGECAGYGEWGCIFDTFKRLKPEAYLTKKAFSPIKINNVSTLGDKIIFDIQNRFDHTNLNEVLVTVKNNNTKIIYNAQVEENIYPHSNGKISLSPINFTDNMIVEFIFNGVTVENIMLNKKYGELKINTLPIKCTYKKNEAVIYHDSEFAAKINAMYLHTGTNNFEIKRSNLKYIGKNTYTANFKNGIAFKLEVSQINNEIKLKVKPSNIFSAFYSISELGVDIEFNDDVKSVSWIRNSLYSIYTDNHIARDCGTAYKAGKCHNYDDTEMSNIAWEQDASAFAYYDKNSEFNHIASNDFRTKRFNINEYLVDTNSKGSVLIKTDSEYINAYSNPFNSKLEISKGSYQKSILWGNYFGEKIRLNKRNNFEFSVSFGNQI